MRFTETRRDAGARAGTLAINGYRINTPTLWLGHNLDRPIHLWHNHGFQPPGVLVNAVQIFRRPFLSQAIRKKGIHKHLGYDGPVMVDSGGFFFQRDGRLVAQQEDIASLCELIEGDIGVVLDYPLDPALSAQQNSQRWERTLKNTEKALSGKPPYAIMPVIHGYTLNDVKTACQQIRDVVGEPLLVGLGSLVPLIKGSYLGNGFSYQRGDMSNGNHITFVADAVKLVRDQFPTAFLHVFGVGGITTALAVFCFGADSVDSVGWRLKASFGAIQLPGISDRFLSPREDSSKARKVIQAAEEEVLAQCDCPICAGYSRLGWQKKRLDGKNFEARAVHNAWVCLKETDALRNAIVAGNSLAFIRERLSRNHRFYRIFSQ